MPNKEELKKAVDAFEDDKYSDSKDIFSKEFKVALNDYLKKELKLKKDVVDDLPKEEPDEDPDEDEDPDGDEDDE